MLQSPKKTLMSRSEISEADIERTCTEWLALDGWRGLKTDPVSRREWGKGFGEPGMADYLYIRSRPSPREVHQDGQDPTNPRAIGWWMSVKPCQAEVMWIEWKSKRGTSADHQRCWHQAERARGALTLIAGEDFPNTIEGFQQWYRSSGLMRRNLR